MHFFFDTVWKLHIGEIPEKPDPKNYLYPGPLVSDLKQYEQAIAAIKQNALTVGNPILCPQNMSAVEPGKFYEWIGGYDIVGMGTVAILTLPEEKKNTMENLTKEQHARLIAERLREDAPTMRGVLIRQNVEHAARMLESFAESSGSVAAPTWYTENEMYDWLTRNNYHENIAKELSSKWAADLQGAFNKGFEKGTRELASLRQQLETLRGFVKEVDASLYHGPDLEDKEIMQHYIEVFKIIKEEARKLLSK